MRVVRCLFVVAVLAFSGTLVGAAQDPVEPGTGEEGYCGKGSPLCTSECTCTEWVVIEGQPVCQTQKCSYTWYP
jgi:hypothetical protein